MQINRIISKLFVLIILLSIISLFLSLKPAHPYYVSISEIRIDTVSKSVNVSCKLFIDDLQDALYRINKIPVNLFKQENENNTMLENYFKERFKLSIGSKALPLKFIGYEIEEEAAWCYLEANKIESSGKVIVLNSLLYDYLPDQTNFIHCYYNQQRKSFKLNNPEKIAIFEF